MEKRSDSAIKLSIVVPVYQSADILPKLVEEVLAAVEPLGLVDRFELLLVNDASPDQSWPVIQSLARSHAFVRGISLRRNFGQHNALMAGLNHVNGDFVVMMDDDLQHPPDAIGDLLDALEQGYDVCYTRYRHRRHALWKQVGSRFNDWVATRLLDKPQTLYLSSFKAVRREIAREVIKYDGPYAYLDGLILDVTRSITVVEIAHQPRYSGESNYTLRRLLSLWLKMATGFSVFPLRLATYAGFILSALSFIMMAFFVIQKLLYPEIPRGWASLIATILFLGGMQTFFLGLIGEYLGRTYLKLNQKAQFVIGSTTWDVNSNEVS